MKMFPLKTKLLLPVILGAMMCGPSTPPLQSAPVRVAKTNAKVAVLTINGMTCGGCVQGISGMLERIPGVETASVDLKKNQATVRYDASRASVSQMRAMIVKAGFKVTKTNSRKA